MIPRLLAVAAGIWLMISPALLDYGNPAAANDRIFGPIGAAFAFVAIWGVIRALRWGSLPVGIWLVVAPFVLGYGSVAPTVSSIAAGAVMVATAPLGGDVKESYGGGWKALLASDATLDQH